MVEQIGFQVGKVLRIMVFSTQKKRENRPQVSVRAIAAQVILQVLDQGKSLSTLIPEVQSQVKPQDLPLLQEITFGICRVLPRLENIIKKLLDKPLKGKTRIVHCLLLVGLYQLLYMRVPAHAAVDEVVNATKSLKSDSSVVWLMVYCVVSYGSKRIFLP